MQEIWELWDNFVYNAPDVFLSNHDMVQATVEMVRYGCKEDADADQLGGGLKMLESLVVVCRGKVDALVQPLLATLLQKIKWSVDAGDEESAMMVACRYCGGVDCLQRLTFASTLLLLWYNPGLTLQLLEQAGVTGQLLNTIAASTDIMSQKKEKVSLNRDAIGVAHSHCHRKWWSWGWRRCCICHRSHCRSRSSRACPRCWVCS